MVYKYSEMWNKFAKVWDLMLSITGYDTAYREEAVKKLDLREGDTVLDLACGTGANFNFLERKVGKEGKIIALDYSREMLKKAKEKIKKGRWHNTEFLEKDASNFELNVKVDAVLCTWAMVSFPNYRKALKNSIKALKKGGRYVVLDLQQTAGITGRILKLFFEATHQEITREPWSDMEKYLSGVEKEDLPLMGGIAMYYIASGTKN
ncbi:MAG: class I SAM-dependent methyltransferase [Candidatus Hydrothermarchaeota archaeon]